VIALYLILTLIFGLVLYLVGNRHSVDSCKGCERYRHVQSSLYDRLIRSFDKGNYTERDAADVDVLAMLIDKPPSEVISVVHAYLDVPVMKPLSKVCEDEFMIEMQELIVPMESISLAGVAKAIEL